MKDPLCTIIYTKIIHKRNKIHSINRPNTAAELHKTPKLLSLHCSVVYSSDLTFSLYMLILSASTVIYAFLKRETGVTNQHNVACSSQPLRGLCIFYKGTWHMVDLSLYIAVENTTSLQQLNICRPWCTQEGDSFVSI